MARKLSQKAAKNAKSRRSASQTETRNPKPETRPAAWCDSMAHAAATSGQAIGLFKRAKQLGAPGFKGSRVCPELVLKFIAQHADQFTLSGPNLDLKDQKLNEEIRKLRLANDIKEGKFVSRAALAEAMARTLPRIGALLEQKLCNELPAEMAGLDVSAARVYGKKLNDQLLIEFEALKTLWDL